MLFAHSSDPDNGIPAQGYSPHIEGVGKLSSQAASEAGRYALRDRELLSRIVSLSAEFHDLGKLDEENQAVLSGKVRAKSLPIQHTDAGTAYLVDRLKAIPPAVLVRSHHIGLPDFIEEKNRTDADVLRDNSVKDRVDQVLTRLSELHDMERNGLAVEKNDYRGSVQGNASIFFRIALSCLADGDHSDTATHYQNQNIDEPEVSLKATERLELLNRYVKNLETGDERSRQRSEVYSACRDSEVLGDIVSCDSPVGTGKTTAVMAHLLSQAEKRKLRRIIVVLPFTNIITQSVEIYRKALVLRGENPEYVVAELHHRADFGDIHSRQFTALWKAPIVVTTAVCFFETLASNSPATLRRLHNLPGSAVFIDESHAALPTKLLPLAWQWIKLFAKEWSCYWVMASGSLNRFWEIEEFDEEKATVPEIMPAELRSTLDKYEKGRIKYELVDIPFDAGELIAWVASLPGPRIVIVNTVQSAAVLAMEYENRFGRLSVEHLSTALTPQDRYKTFAKIKSRLENAEDKDWTIFATSCVEAGVDFSFKTGVREAASMVSLLQTAGRVNRHNHVEEETVWTINLKESNLLKKNPGMFNSAKVLMDLYRDGRQISPELCTLALKREVRLDGAFTQSLFKSEQQLRFPAVEKDFKVIASNTRTVVVDAELVKKMEGHHPVNWRDVQKSSVNISGYRLDALHIPEVSGYPDVYKWPHNYNDFVGYMAGVIKIEAFKAGDISVC